MKFTGDFYCEVVVNYNCDRICSHTYCSDIYTKFFDVTINNISMKIGLCDKHSEELEDYNGVGK